MHKLYFYKEKFTLLSTEFFIYLLLYIKITTLTQILINLTLKKKVIQSKTLKSKTSKINNIKFYKGSKYLNIRDN